MRKMHADGPQRPEALLAFCRAVREHLTKERWVCSVRCVRKGGWVQGGQHGRCVRHAAAGRGNNGSCTTPKHHRDSDPEDGNETVALEAALWGLLELLCVGAARSEGYIAEVRWCAHRHASHAVVS